MIMWKGRLEVNEAVKIIVPTVEALAYAHEKGLIHRDVRSSNIIITDVGRPVLTDFWVDHSFRGAKLSGALEYMSPEEAEGKELTRSSNIYCFGIILYEALTGKVPFLGSNPFEIVGKIIGSTPVFPRKIASTIPDWMEEIVLRCLAKNPKDRFATAAELAAALLRARYPLPVSVSQPVAQKSTDSYTGTRIKTKQPKVKKNSSPVAVPSPRSKLFRKNKKETTEKVEKITVFPPFEKKIEKPVEEIKKKPRLSIHAKPILRIAIPLVMVATIAVVMISNPNFFRRGEQDQSQAMKIGINAEEPVTTPAKQPNQLINKNLNAETDKGIDKPLPDKIELIPKDAKNESQKAPSSNSIANSSKVPSRIIEKLAMTTPSKIDQPTIKVKQPDKIEKIIPSINIQWVYVDSGTFQMGSNSYPSTKPLHTVKVPSFYMSATEITFEQYDKFSEATGTRKPNDNGWGRGKMPVVNVSWNDAVAFCRWVSEQTGKTVRLPTEAEFEFAARGGAKSGNYAYSGSNSADFVSWYADNSGGKPHVVATKAPNELGLYDMSGNVWEWCEDWYHQSYDGAPVDGKVWNVQDRYNPYRVVRGGSANGAIYCGQVAFRFWLAPFFKDKVIGFRVVQEIK